MFYDPPTFFTRVRASLFGGKLTQPQVDGLNALLTYWGQTHPTGDKRWLAYCLATAFPETAQTMQPIAEYGKGAGHAYGVPDPVTGQVYYGRGYVQLTWKGNYQKQATKIGVDFVSKPDLVMIPEYAAAILFSGMISGDFTGLGLERFFNTTTDDAVDARRIINGTDCAAQIAGYHAQFMLALSSPGDTMPTPNAALPDDTSAGNNTPVVSTQTTEAQPIAA